MTTGACFAEKAHGPYRAGWWVVRLAFAAMALAACLLCGCTQSQLGSSAEGWQEGSSSAAEPTEAQQGSSGNLPVADVSAQSSTASGTSGAFSRAAGNEALRKAWESDFARAAEDAGMSVSVSAYDPASGTAAAYRADKKMLSASMIKLLVAEAFLKQVAEGAHDFDDVYVLQESDIVGGAGSLGGRGAGAEVTKRELVEKMISESDNVAANALIDLCGMEEVNAEAKRLGLKRTQLERHMMDEDAMASGKENYTCADDIALLLEMVYDQTFVNEELSAFMLKCLEAQTDNEGILDGLPAEVTFAHKTGALATVLHDGGIVEGEHPFVIVVLCGGEGFNGQGALDAMAQIGEAAYHDLEAAG